MRSSKPNIFAALMVIALTASISGNPSFIANPAHNGKYSWGTTGESVVIAIRIPSLYNS